MYEYTGGMPLDISDQKKLWGGFGKTNGILHKNVDGRIPALKGSWARIMPAKLESPLSDRGIIPWGNGFWRNLAVIDNKPNTMYPDKPDAGLFAGILLFEQGWQSGNPIVGYGLVDYTRGTVVPSGLVGYQTSLAAVGEEENYYKFLQNQADRAYNKPEVRKSYKEWMADLKAAGDGSKLGIFFGNDSGFPLVAPVAAADLANPVLTDAVFGGFGRLFEPENEIVYFEIEA
jgi:hypothetical protein